MRRRWRYTFFIALVAVLAATMATYPEAAVRGRAAAGRAKVVAQASTTDTGVRRSGVGTYTDASVANQISNFTINRSMVSCGVGTIAAGDWSGPFAMLMYATRISSYNVDPKTSTIRATGTMRSITEIAGMTVEDVRHAFLAVAVDGGEETPDRFDVNFVTPFWNEGNPMCTPSSLVAGACRFGGELVMGDVGVS